MEEVLDNGSFFIFQSRPKLDYIVEHKHFMIYLVGTGGKQLQVTIKVHEEGRLINFWNKVTNLCQREWPLDWEVADSILRQGWDEALDLCPA